MTPGKWRKSSRSGGGANNCVETRTFNVVAAPVEVRDSKAPELGSLAINRAEFTALLDSVKLQRLAAVHLAEVGRCFAVWSGCWRNWICCYATGLVTVFNGCPKWKVIPGDSTRKMA